MTPPMRSDDATTREGVQIPEGAHVVIQVPPMPESELVKHLQDMYVQVQRDLSRYRVDAMNEAQRRRAAEDERDDLEREATTLAAEVERVKGENAELRAAMALFGVEKCKPCGGTGVQESLDDDHAYDPCDRCGGDQWTTYLEEDVKALHSLRKILTQGEEVLCRHCQEQVAKLQAQEAE